MNAGEFDGCTIHVEPGPADNERHARRLAYTINAVVAQDRVLRQGDQAVLFADAMSIARAEICEKVAMMRPHLFEHDGIGFDLVQKFIEGGNAQEPLAAGLGLWRGTRQACEQ